MSAKLTAVDSERIAANAAALRLFKGEYRDSGDRHSDALIVRERNELLESQRAADKALIAELREALARAVAHHSMRCDIAVRAGVQPPSKESWINAAKALLARTE